MSSQGNAQIVPRPGSSPVIFGSAAAAPAPVQNFALNGHLLALVLCLLTSLLAHAGALPSGFGWLARLAAFFEPFAWPAYFAFAGFACHGLLQVKWQDMSRDYIEPAIIYSALWVALTAAAIYGANFLMLPALAASLRATIGIWEVPALLALPALMLTAQRFIGPRPLLLLLLAIALHVMEPRTGFAFIDAALSGFIYFVIGTLYARQLRGLAAWASKHTTLALLFLCVWCLYNALTAFYPTAVAIPALVNLPLAGAPLTSLPFAKLGLAFAGIGAVTLLAGLIGHVQSVRALAAEPRIAHLWRPVTLLTPFVFGLLSGLLVTARLAPSHAGALAVLAVMGFTALVTIAVVRVFGLTQTPAPQELATTVKLQAVRQLNGSSTPQS